MGPSSLREGHDFEIQLGHVCNNRCVFCSSGQLSESKLANPVPLDEALEAISRARAEGAARIIFLGGEPTLHKDFFEALEHASRVGFERIVVFTNGALLSRPEFVERVCGIAPVEWRLSIQGGNRKSHEAVTRRKGSFDRILEGLHLLHGREQQITANMCLCEQNYRTMPELPSLILGNGVRQLHVDIIRPSSTGERTEEYLGSIMPRYSTMAPYMDEMLERFESLAPGFDVHIGNLPYCVLPLRFPYIRHGGRYTETKSSDPFGLEEAVDKYAWHSSMRRHVSACRQCDLRLRCSGVFCTYLDLYGDEEFSAVSYEMLYDCGLQSSPPKTSLSRAAIAEHVPVDAFGTKLAPSSLTEGVASAGLKRFRLVLRDGGMVLECDEPSVRNIAVARAVTWLTSRLSPMVSVDVSGWGSFAGEMRGRLVDRRRRRRKLVALTEITNPEEDFSSVIDGLLERLPKPLPLEDSIRDSNSERLPESPQVTDQLCAGLVARLSKALPERLFIRKLDPAGVTISVLDRRAGRLVVTGAAEDLDCREASVGGPHFLVWFRPGGDEGVRPAALIAASRSLWAIRWLGMALAGFEQPFSPEDPDLLLDGLAWKVSRRPTVAGFEGGDQGGTRACISLESSRCQQCGTCERICPEDLGPKAGGAGETARYCKSCYECVEACPADALRPTYGPDTSTLASMLLQRRGWLSRLAGLPGPALPAPFTPSYLKPRAESSSGPVYVLGLAVMTMQEHAAVLFKDGRLVGAIELERLNRKRHSGWHPPGRPHATLASDPTLCLEEAICRKPIRALLQKEGISLDDVDVFALNGLHGRHVERISFIDAGNPLPKIRAGRVLYVPHHLCHASSVYRVSGFDSALIVTVDGRGDRECAAVYRGEGRSIHMVDTLLSLVDRSIGGVYEGVTRLLGFGPHGQGSVMALASFGEPTFDFRDVLCFEKHGEPKVHETAVQELFGHLERGYGEPLRQEHKDLAASLQAALEEFMLELVRQTTGQASVSSLCLAGGVALNCRMNEKLRRTLGCEHIFVQPAANDGGTALGAALEACVDLGCNPDEQMQHAFTGPSFDDDEIERILLSRGIEYQRSDSLALEVAERLARGEVVCWFQGSMEFGPRALGARSILADPRRSDMHARVNEIKERESWRPFGPSILSGHEEEWFDGAFDTRFMLFTVPVRSDKRGMIPAVVHIDGTTRPQVVHSETSPVYHEMLTQFHRLSGVPMVLNTSYNRRGEPIVCSPRDAIEAFEELGADTLAIGGYIVERRSLCSGHVPLDEELKALPGGRRLSLRVAAECSLDCVHCTIRDLQGLPGRSFDDAKRALVEGRKAGCDELVIMREPTLWDELPNLIRTARRMGYSFVQLQTNAYGLTRPGVMERLLSAGIDFFEVLLLSGGENLHDELTRCAGSYRPTLRAVRDLLRAGQKVMGTVPVLTGNMRHLGGIVLLSHKLGLQRIQLAFPRPVELDGNIVADAVPRLSNAAAFVPKAADIARKHGITVGTEAFPFCHLPRSMWNSTEAHEDWSRHRVDDFLELHESKQSVRDIQRPVPPPCRSCNERKRCPGTWPLYLEMFGSDELKPFAKSR